MSEFGKEEVKLFSDCYAFQEKRVANFFLLAIASGACLLLGCAPAEPERAQISGQISYQGKPVHYGHIVFIPIDSWDGFYSQAEIINGEYSLSEHGPILGKNRVEIHGHRKTGEKAPDISGKRLNEPTVMSESTEPYLPAKYNVASELTIDIHTGKNESADFNLE